MKKSIVISLGLLFIIALAKSQSTQSFHDVNTSESHHNKYELEISVNNDSHIEYTGSLYFLPKKKVQVTADETLHHFASVIVQELPFGNSHWGTFIGVGGTLGFIEHEDHNTHELVTENHAAIIAQSGLAYALDTHWSTGFTFSPGWDINENHSVFGLTFDLVFGF